MKICKITITTMLAIAMTFTMMPLNWGAGSNVYAETAAADGGIVASNSETDALNAFGSDNVTAEYTGQKLTITMQKDITLSGPVRFQEGEEGDTVILDLNGHTIKGAKGVDGKDSDAAQGGNAIEIAASQFDVEITDTSEGEKGSVIGGTGAVYENDSGYREGERGGSAVFFVNDESNNEYMPGELQYGLAVTGGATLAGGAGADVDFDDWYANVCAEPEFIKDSTFFIEAGRGGDAISQEFSNTHYLTIMEEKTFAKICIIDGAASGGAGGNVNIGNSHPFTQTALTGLQMIQDYIRIDPNYYGINGYYANISDRIRLQQGNGGNGIMFAAGRKYIDIEVNGAVTGGQGGKIDYGKKGEKVNRIPNNYNFSDWHGDLATYNRGAGGAAICGWGDLGLTNESSSMSDVNTDSNYWGKKTKNSEDIGLYVAGSVRGGDACSTTAMCDYALEGGDGVKFNTNDARYCKPYSGDDLDAWDGDIGIVYIDERGSIAGGNGGSAINGKAGDGGSGILENASSNDLAAAVNHFIINGTVTGGNGGYSGSKGIASNNSLSPVKGSGAYGCGGNAILFGKKLNQNKMIAGADGVLQGGDYGCAAYRSGDKIDSQNRFLDYYDRLMFAPAVDADNADTVDFYGTVTRTDGDFAYARKGNMTSFSAAATMTPFTSGPTTGTILSCNVTTPEDYDGKVYYRWCATICTGGNYDSYDGDNTEFDIEGKGTAIQQFNLLSDADYHNTVSAGGTSSAKYGVHAVTANLLAERTKYNDNTRVTIYCYAMLEDGRYIKSNEIWFTMSKRSSTGWSGSPGVITDPDQEEADAVAAMIEALPNLTDLSLDDLEAVEAARAAYEALTDEQKELLAPFTYLLNDLEAAEQKIEGLRTEVTDVEDLIDNLINSLPVLSKIPPDDTTAIAEAKEQIAAAKDQIAAAVAAYNDLADDQKERANADKVAALTEFVETYNGMSEDDEDIDTLVPPSKKLTADMITVAGATYTGKALTPKVTVKDGDKVLAEGTDYTKTYSNNVNAGKGKVTVTGEGAYRRAVTKEFTINPKVVTPSVTLSTKKYTYNAKARKPGVTVKVGTAKLAATQYTVSYAAGRKNVGTYKVTVTLKGNYKGTKAASFTIVPKGAAIVKPKAANKAITVKWKKQSAKMATSRITGYQVQCCTSKAFKSGVKKKTVKGYGKTSVKISKLKKKKTYYVRVRTYMKTGGKTYYSNWSKVLKTKTK